MILADKLRELISYSPEALTRIVQASGYTKDSVNEAMFIGMTNGGEFCYRVDYDDFGEMTTCKLFVKYDPTTGRVSADY
jgi:hypothetical protein